MPHKLQDWSVLPPGAQETLGVGTFTAVVKYIGPWSDRIKFAETMIGRRYEPKWVDDSSRLMLTTIHPRGVSATMSAYKGDQQAISARSGRYSNVTWMESYEKAVVTVTYELPGIGGPVQVEGDRGRGDWISENFQPSAEFSTLDKDHFEWFDENSTLTDKLKTLKENDAPGKLFVGMDYVFTRHGVTSISPELFTTVNHVNLTAIALVTPLLSTITFAPETMLYRGASLDRSVSKSGESTMDLVMTFSMRQIPDPIVSTRFYGWNHFFHAGAGRWLRLKRKEDGGIHLNYPSAELQNL